MSSGRGFASIGSSISDGVAAGLAGNLHRKPIQPYGHRGYQLCSSTHNPQGVPSSDAGTTRTLPASHGHAQPGSLLHSDGGNPADARAGLVQIRMPTAGHAKAATFSSALSTTGRD